MDEFDDMMKKLQIKIDLVENCNIEIKDILNALNKKLNTKNDNILNIRKIMEKYPALDSEIIKFNIGGTIFSTLKSTITKLIKKPNKDEYYSAHLLEGLISGIVDIKLDEDKAIFLDRNPNYFQYVLDYIRTANTEKMIKLPKDKDQLNDILDEAKFFKLEGFEELIYLYFLNVSSIIKRNQIDDFLKLCELDKKHSYNLIYKGTRDGFAATSFHSKCDGKANTLTIIETTQNYIFGVYATTKWSIENKYEIDPNAFIFSFRNPTNNQLKIKCTSEANSIYCKGDYGPTVGGGHDFHISNNSNQNNQSYCNLGHSYKHPTFAYQTNEAKNFLAGSYNFQVKEIEVYQID